MFRAARSVLSLSRAKSSKNVRSIATHGFKQQELNEKETEMQDENLDSFTKEFLGNKIRMTDFQRILLTAGSSIAALLDPRRQDMIACLGETTGEEALHKIIQVMRASGEGQEILRVKPRINTRTVNLSELKELPPDTFGHHYYKFLEDNVSASVLNFLITNFNISASDARLTTGSSLHGRSAAGVRDDALSRDSRLGSYDLGNADEHAG